MSYYTRPRSRESPTPDWFWWVIGVSVFLVLCGLGINLASAWRRGAVEKTVTAVESRRVDVLASVGDAEKEVGGNAGKFASHWSEGFPDQLEHSRQNLADNGQVVALINQARAELKADHLDEAKSLADQADAIVTASFDVVNKILGPPKYYAELQWKSDEVDRGFLEIVKNEITAQKKNLDSLTRSPLCGSDKQQTFRRSYDTISTAEDDLGIALTANTTRVDGLIDKPVVYDQAAKAFQSSQGAVASANEEIANLATAISEIANAEAIIKSTNDHIAISFYRTDEASIALDGARNTLQLAKNACFQEDLTSALNYARDATNQARNARDIATRPTEPPPQPVIIIVHDDNNNGGNSGGGASSSGQSDSSGDSSWSSNSDSSWGSDSGSDSNSSSGSDWSGSDNSWDSGSSSDWGGSDSGGFDSGSSDWGGSDSGSWDSGSDW